MTGAFVIGCLIPACGRPPVRQAVTSRHVVDGGRYVIELQSPPGGSELKMYSHSQGKTVTAEHYELTWGTNQSLKIDNGQLTVNGRPSGTLERGDKIYIRSDGAVLVNGVERPSAAAAAPES
ncbi:MAG: hypothetical protein ACKV19_10780 [Verrucomicrobiales bacterium]